MSTDAANDTTEAKPTDPRVHEVIPLSEWITGTLTMHFKGGATVNRRMTLAEAQSIQQILGDTRSSDRLDWFHLSWIQFNSKVDASTFDTDEDLGWGLTPEDRAALKGTHRHGIFHTLRAIWKTKNREPSFSPYAMWNLHWAALDGLSGDDFAIVAAAFEGADGDHRLQAAHDVEKGKPTSAASPTAQPRPPSSADLTFADIPEPEDAASAPPATSTGAAAPAETTTTPEADPVAPVHDEGYVEEFGTDDDLNLD